MPQVPAARRDFIFAKAGIQQDLFRSN